MNKLDLWTPPQLALVHPSLFTKLELDLYEKEILSNSKATERDASEFFNRFPQFLLLGVGKDISQEVELINSRTGKRFYVDFLRQSYGSAAWDIIELKTPQIPFAVGTKGHFSLSSKVTKAIDQAKDYRDLINEDAELRAMLLKQGKLVYRPQILIIAGKHNKPVPQETLLVLYDRARQGPIEVMSYDDVFKFAKELYEDCKAIVILGQIGDTREKLSEDMFAYKAAEEAIQSIVASKEHLDRILLSIAQFDFQKNFIVISYAMQQATEMAKKYAQTFELSKKLASEVVKQYEQTWNLATEAARQMILFDEMMRKQLTSIAPILKSMVFRFKPLP